MLKLHQYYSKFSVIPSKEEDAACLLVEPLMNIEDIASEALGILDNDGHNVGNNSGGGGRRTTSPRILDNDDPFIVNGRATYGNISPRPIDPSQFYVVDKIPLNRSLISQILDDTNMSEVLMTLRQDEAVSTNRRLRDLPNPSHSASLERNHPFFDLSTSQPSPLAAPSADIFRIDDTGDISSSRKRRKLMKMAAQDGHEEAKSWEVPNRKLDTPQVPKKNHKPSRGSRSSSSPPDSRDSSNSTTDDVNDDDGDSFSSTSSDDESESDVQRFRPYQYEQWQEKFEELCKFKKKHGHCNVPGKPRRKRKTPMKGGDATPPPEIMMLWRWVKRQKYQYKLFKEGKQSTLSQERITALERIGITWDCHTSTWSDRLSELAKYHSEHGDCNVPSKYPPNPKLSTWVKVRSSSSSFEPSHEFRVLSVFAHHTKTMCNFVNLPPRNNSVRDDNINCTVVGKHPISLPNEFRLLWIWILFLIRAPARSRYHRLILLNPLH